MRKLSITAFACLLILWGSYFYLKDDTINPAFISKQDQSENDQSPLDLDSPLYQKERRDLDKIGTVINEQNVDLDHETKAKIKVAKKIFDIAANLKEKQNLLEQSYMDRASTIKDIKRLQNEIIEVKYKLRTEPANTEKWDPKFVYYLMIQENYTYQEINGIRSLTENGLNTEEINYINDLIKEEPFMDRITSFKSQGDVGRIVASAKKKPKEKDDFIEGPDESISMESKIIEMDYNQDDKEEMVYGSHQ